MSWGTLPIGHETALEVLHVTGKYRTQHDAHMLQACGLGSSHTLPMRLYVTLSCSSPARTERFARELGNASNPGSVYVCIIEQCPNPPATPATPSNRSHPRPLSLLGQLGIPGTLLQFGLSGHFTKLGHFGCHGLDELLLSELRIENLELQAGKTQQILNCTGVLLWCLVLAQEVEQSAYVPGGLCRPPACLDKAKTSRSAADFSRTWWIL